MVEEAIVSAMWHRTRKCYVPLTLDELLEKTGLERTEITRATDLGYISKCRNTKGMQKLVCICEITEAGKRLHKATKGN